MGQSYKYKFGISFTGEDRQLASELYERLRKYGKVLCDCDGDVSRRSRGKKATPFLAGEFDHVEFSIVLCGREYSQKKNTMAEWGVIKGHGRYVIMSLDGGYVEDSGVTIPIDDLSSESVLDKVLENYFSTVSPPQSGELAATHQEEASSAPRAGDGHQRCHERGILGESAVLIGSQDSVGRVAVLPFDLREWQQASTRLALLIGCLVLVAVLLGGTLVSLTGSRSIDLSSVPVQEQQSRSPAEPDADRGRPKSAEPSSGTAPQTRPLPSAAVAEPEGGVCVDDSRVLSPEPGPSAGGL